MGLFMGNGVVADNGRNERQIEAPAPTGVEDFLGAPGFPASLLILSGNRNVDVRAWADHERPYLRMGFQPESLTPARAFDALLYVREVGPPDYRIP